MTSDLDHVLFIGGAPGVGKTTVASILARRHGFRLYSADTHTWEHRDRAIAAGNAAAIAWEALSAAERPMQPDADLIAQSLYRERGAMVLADLAALPSSTLIVAEGTVIKPADAPAEGEAVWLVSDSLAQRARLEERDGQSSRLYELTREVIASDVAAARAATIVAGTLVETAAAVDAFFVAAIARGPHAETLDERRALLRQANLDIVNQVRGYYARSWAVGNPEAVVRTFICECGGTACQAFLTASVHAVATTRLVAGDHMITRGTR